MSSDLLALPPQDLEAEQSVLGAILLDGALLSTVSGILARHDFYKSAHAVIYDAMEALADDGQPIDHLTLSDQLRKTGQLESVGGSSYLAELLSCVSSTANIKHHCQMVQEKSLRRRLGQAGLELHRKAYDEQEPLSELLDTTEKHIFAVVQGQDVTTFEPLGGLLKGSLDDLDRLYKRRTAVTGVPSGFPSIDRMTAGWQPGDLVIIGARPSMGKTSLALGMALHAALKEKLVVGIFSLEMPKKQLTLRLLSAEASIDAHMLRTGQLHKDAWWRLSEAVGRLEGLPLFIDDSGGLTVAQLRGKARRLKAERGLSLLIVDYLQLMQGRSDSESRQQEISDISRSLKSLAKELDVPVIALSQLSRAVEARRPPIPMLADLRESGAIEQDADVVMFIYREDFYDPDSQRKGIAEILIRKHRNGPTGDLMLHFSEQHARFSELEHHDN